MDKTRSYGWIVCMFLSFGVYAQDATNFTQYFINPYSINPSYAGIEGRSALFLTYRKQWANVEGGPTIGNLSFHTPLAGGLNFGLNVMNDRRGILNTSGLMFTFGYTLAIDQQSFIRFGFSAGGAWNGIDFGDLEPSDPLLSDPVFAGYLENNASLLGNVGLSIHIKSFHIGAALPNIFSPSIVSLDQFNVTEVKPFQSIIVHASNRFYFANDMHIFEPYLLYRINEGLPSQYEAAAVLHLNHVLWFGGSYKQDFGISALGGIKLQSFFLIGGSYSLKNTGINELNSPSYEVQLSYIFGAKKKNKPVYSFVNSVKEKIRPVRKSASELLAERRKQEEIEKKKQEELAKKQEEEQRKKDAEAAAALAKQQEEQRKKDEAVAKQQEEQRKQDEAVAKQQEEQRKRDEEARNKQQNTPPVDTPPVETPPVETPPARHDGGPRLKSDMLIIEDVPSYDTAHHEEQARIARLTEHADDPDEEHGLDNDLHPHAERHEFVRKGGHQEEMDFGDYIIAGVFKSSANARHFSEGLGKLGFVSDWGHLTEKGLWYVYIGESNDINEARAERDRFRKMKIFRDAWLLTVHE